MAIGSSVKRGVGLVHPGRRDFLRNSGLSLAYATLLGGLGCSVCGSAAAQTGQRVRMPQVPGCVLQGDDAVDFAEQNAHSWITYSRFAEIFETSGNSNLDRAFGMMLAHLSQTFRVNPRFYFYDDGRELNAYATDEIYDPEYRHGTVFMGMNFMDMMLGESQYGDILLMAVCAHEFGHIVQYFTSGLAPRLRAMHQTVKYMELHADYLAGYYVARRSAGYEAEQLRHLGEGWEASGDTAFNDPNHHGTQAERIAAIEAGFGMASTGGGAIDDAIQSGLAYLAG